VAVSVVVGVALSATGLGGCSSGTSPGAQQKIVPAPVPTPLATSLITAGGTWATVPMGQLNDPENTFWQLLFRPAGASTWSDQVGATGVATNGGLVLASPGDRSFVAGILASQLLTYPPLIATTNQGRSWTNGLLPTALAARVDALATDPAGASLALVKGRDGNDLLSATSGLSTWTPLVTQAGLSSAPAARSCGIASLDAVAFASNLPVLGVSCTQPGVVGVMTYGDGAWRLAGPPVPSPFDQEAISVFALESTAPAPDGRGKPGTVALLDATSAAGHNLIAAWTEAGGGTWNLSPALSVTSSETIASVGPDGGQGVFVLISEPGGSRRLEHATGSGEPWLTLPAPPAGTATVAFGPNETTQALAVNGATLTVWNLPPDASAWIKAQVLPVQIEYGSSS
jgi:hypothetical protein